jgi:hypothetical protein
MAQYMEYTDPDTGLKVRDGARDGAYVLDMELTVLGFGGVESVDEGLTGDWIEKEEIKPS